jgi:hypothetical protein
LAANAAGPIANLITGSFNAYFNDETSLYPGLSTLSTGTPYLIISQVNSPSVRAGYINGTPDTFTAPSAAANPGIFNRLGWRDTGTPNYSDGDIAEIIFYNAALGSTSLQNIQKGLSDKYGLGITGGTPIQPNDSSVVANLVGWWKADSL